MRETRKIVLNKKEIKGFIFDCDGVLIDSREANLCYYNLILRKLGLPDMDAECADYVHTHTVQESISRIVPPALLDQAVQVAKGIPYAQVLELIRLEKGLQPLLNWLKKQGFLLAINTNRTTTMDSLLEHFALTDIFYPVVTALKVKRPKPDPESVDLILQIWSEQAGTIRADQVVYIGDSAVDEQTARSAGVEFWAYKNPDLSAAVHVFDFETLLVNLSKEQTGWQE